MLKRNNIIFNMDIKIIDQKSINWRCENDQKPVIMLPQTLLHTERWCI